MFDFLKKKITGLIDGLTKKEEDKEEPEKAVPGKIIPPAPKPEKKIEIAKPAEKIQPAVQKPETSKAKLPEPKPPKAVAVGSPVPVAPEPAPAAPRAEPKPEAAAPPKPPEAAKQQTPEAVPKPETPKPQPKEIPQEKPRIKLGAISSIKSFITREVEITEGDVRDLLDSFELELLEADVEMTVAESITREIRSKLVGAKIAKDRLHQQVNAAIRETLLDVITNEKAFDMVERARASEKPLKIMFLGINGAGKTTTIAKVARLLMDNDMKVVLAAADTFRAAAIEQMAVHADRLGVKMIKRDYGSDPTSVAYDAVNYAKAHGIDAVLIDTAGRQDTNISLLNEMKKMTRVIQPDIKVYIGESIAGNAIIEQVSAFNREIGLDAVILTKLDCDPKGGTMLSINRATEVPIIYVGVGQEYGDLEKFEPERIVERIMG